MLELPLEAAEAIRAHGKKSYGEEACGALYGELESRGKRVVGVAPLPNARSDERHRRFVVTPEDYRSCEAEASRRGLTLLGFYHSHPDHPAYPSAFDLEHAFPFFSYVIVAVAKGEPGDLRSFVLADDRRQFLEETIERKE